MWRAMIVHLQKEKRHINPPGNFELNRLFHFRGRCSRLLIIQIPLKVTGIDMHQGERAQNSKRCDKNYKDKENCLCVNDAKNDNCTFKNFKEDMLPNINFTYSLSREKLPLYFILLLTYFTFQIS